MFEYIKHGKASYVRCLECEFIEETLDCVHKDSVWTCSRCEHVHTMHQVFDTVQVNNKESEHAKS